MSAIAPTTLDFSAGALAFIDEIVPNVDVTGAMLDQRFLEDGTQQDVVYVWWRMLGRPGTIQTWVPAITDWNYAAIGGIQYDYAVVNAIYEGQPNQDAIVQTQPPPLPPAPAGPAQPQ